MAVPAPRVKICGITNLEDAELAAGHGAWALGLIFFPPSPRRCSIEAAERIGAAMHRRAEICGVFVNATLDEIESTADRARLTMVQLHGDEGPAYCAEVARRTGARVIKSRQVRTAADLRSLEPFHTDYHLLDSHARGLRGGTGEPFDWRMLRGRRQAVPLILSGGLTPENVGGAIARVRPFAVDVASGVEAEPGRKDPGRLAAFFAAVTEARAAPADAEADAPEAATPEAAA